MEILLKTARATWKGDLYKKKMKVDCVEDLPELVPCGNPDCVDGGFRLQEGVRKALVIPSRAARMKCIGKESSGRKCWNMLDVAVTRKPGEE